MKTAWKTVVPVLMALMLLLATASGLAAASYPLSPSDDAIQDALSYLRSQQSFDGSIGGYADSAWVCIAIAAAGEDPDTWENGGDSLVDFLKSGPPGDDLSGEFNMGTYLARMVLAAVAAGEDPEAFGSWSGSQAGVTITNGDYLGALVSLYDGAQFLQDLTGAADSAETLNDDFWALRAVVAAGESPYSSMVQNTAQFIMANQEDDGGWTWGTPSHTWYMPDATDVDNTAAAIVALCLAKKAGSGAVSDGLDFLQANQDTSGGFIGYWTGVNVMSTAWCVDAIGAAGQHPGGSAWMPDNDSAVDYLLAEQALDGSIGGSIRATSDAVLALVGAYYRAPAAAMPAAVGGEALRPDKTGVLLFPALSVMALALGATLMLRRKTT